MVIEEFGYVEMIVMMIVRFFEDVLFDQQEKVVEDLVIGFILGGMNFYYVIVLGFGVMLESSIGVFWSGGYIVVSGNLLVDFCVNLNVEL